MPPRRPAPASTAQSSTAGRTSQPTAGPSSQTTVDPGTWLQLVMRREGGSRTEVTAVRDLGSTLPWFSEFLRPCFVRPRLTEQTHIVYTAGDEPALPSTSTSHGAIRDNPQRLATSPSGRLDLSPRRQLTRPLLSFSTRIGRGPCCRTASHNEAVNTH